MISVTVDGYVSKNPEYGESSYGRYAELTLRVGTASREVHYVTARFYGRKIRPIQEFVNNGDYMTMTGCANSLTERKSEGRAGTYVQIYLRDAYYTLPPKMPGAGSFTSVSASDREAAASSAALVDSGAGNRYTGEDDPF